MLLRFGMSNFKSIREFQELSLVASSLSGDPAAIIRVHEQPFSLLRVAAIYGANASGKSNVIAGLEFIRSAVRDSQNKWEPGDTIARQPFALDQSRDKPSEFSVDFLVEGTRCEYSFSMDDKTVLHESLYAYPANRRQRWFERTHGRGRMEFGKNLTGENRTIENLTRPGSLFLSAAAQNNHEKLLPIYNWFTSRLAFRSGMGDSAPSRTIELCLENKSLKETVLRLIAAADLGVVGLEVREEIPARYAALGEKLKNTVGTEMWVLFEEQFKSLRLLHKGSGGKPIPLEPEQESAGTRAYLAMLGPVIEVLSSGGVLCVDELEASLHPLVVAEVVKTFNRSEHNLRGAQLIFNTHDTNLLNESLLRRDEVWFTEKDETGATRLYPLSDFKPRREENLQRGYLQGRYGATPFVDSLPVAEDKPQ